MLTVVRLNRDIDTVMGFKDHFSLNSYTVRLNIFAIRFTMG